MSDLLTHWAVFDDVRRLAHVVPGVDPFLTRVMEHEREYARLGAITRGGGWWVPHILREAREAEAAHGTLSGAGEAAENEGMSRRVAFALGGIAHFACDAVMKPVLSTYAGRDWGEYLAELQEKPGATRGDTRTPQEVSAYYDAHVFRKVYLSGREEPFHRFLLADNATDAGRELEQFIRALFQRALLASHTLNPPKEDFDRWLEMLFAQVQGLYLDVGIWCEAFARPDSRKMELYGVETAFYREEDVAVRAARAVQRGESVSEQEALRATDEETNRGAYGRSIALGLRVLLDASGFWRKERSEPPSLDQRAYFARQ